MQVYVYLILCGKWANLAIQYWSSESILVEVFTQINISNNKLTPDLPNCGYFTVSTNAIANANKNNTSYIYITKVVKYKNL